LRNFLGRFFLGGFFWNDFFVRIFLGEFLGGILWEELLSRNEQGIDVFVKDFEVILSKWKEEEF
jgi:hypothetical protein